MASKSRDLPSKSRDLVSEVKVWHLKVKILALKSRDFASSSRHLASRIKNDCGLTGQKHMVAGSALLLCDTYVLRNPHPCETISLIAKIAIKVLVATSG